MGSVVYGHLTGRKLISDNLWSKPCIYSGSGYCYSVPENMSNDKIPCTYYYFEAEGFDIIRSEKLNLSNAEKFEVASDKWKRWKNISIKPQLKPSETIDLDNEEYKLVWADTHCHSNFSPNAEGELDKFKNKL